jgi:NAD(P)-dependent dehydrogenase (short-subunit alcohol dehydrogenase family)
MAREAPPSIPPPLDFITPVDWSIVAGQSALVTGGASGLGAALVEALAAAGASVTIADINFELGQRLAAKLVEKGHEVTFVQTDVRRWEAQVAAFKVARAQVPSYRVDIVIACAVISGIDRPMEASDAGPDSVLADMTPPDTTALDTGLRGAYYTSCLASYHFRKQNVISHLDKPGHLVLISYSLPDEPKGPWTLHSAVQDGIRGLWRSLRKTSTSSCLRTSMLIVGRSGELNNDRRTEIDQTVECLRRLLMDEKADGRVGQAQTDIHSGHFELIASLWSMDANECGKTR